MTPTILAYCCANFWPLRATKTLCRGPATYLSDIKPSKYEHVSFLGPSWPLIHDGSATGHELRLAGSTYDKGLGTHAECHITYALVGNYRWFEARVGLDPDHGQRG